MEPQFGQNPGVILIPFEVSIQNRKQARFLTSNMCYRRYQLQSNRRQVNVIINISVITERPVKIKKLTDSDSASLAIKTLI